DRGPLVPLPDHAGLLRAGASAGAGRTGATRWNVRPGGEGDAEGAGTRRAGERQKGKRMTSDCLFCRIARGELPSRKAYEDDEFLAFHDIHPAAPVHLLVIPKQHLDSLDDARPEHEALLGKLTLLAPRLAKEQGCDNGFRVVI